MMTSMGLVRRSLHGLREEIHLDKLGFRSMKVTNVPDSLREVTLGAENPGYVVYWRSDRRVVAVEPPAHATNPFEAAFRALRTEDWGDVNDVHGIGEDEKPTRASSAGSVGATKHAVTKREVKER